MPPLSETTLKELKEGTRAAGGALELLNVSLSTAAADQKESRQ